MALVPGTDNARLRSALAHARCRRPVLPVYWATAGRCGCGRADCPSPAKHPVPHLVPDGVRHATTSLVRVGGKEPGLVRQPGKLKHPDLTGMNDGHTETPESGAE